MKYFSIKELCKSDTAEKYNINNNPTPDVEKNLIRLVNNLLDPIREKWGKPIKINSGYRSKKLNFLIGGAETSQHCKGEAVDITTGSKAYNKDLFEMIKNSGLVFDQLIDEKKFSWIHISLKASGNRSQIFSLK